MKFSLLCALLWLAPQAASGPQNSLQASLRNILKLDEWESPVKYAVAFVDLNGDGAMEAIVHVVGQDWCGSGGCATLILTPAGDSYRLVTRLTITHLPIRVLKRSSHGWRNLSVRVGGGGIRPWYDAELVFDGKSYPSNPTMPPARKLKEFAREDIVIPSSPSLMSLPSVVE